MIDAAKIKHRCSQFHPTDCAACEAPISICRHAGVLQFAKPEEEAEQSTFVVSGIDIHAKLLDQVDAHRHPPVAGSGVQRPGSSVLGGLHRLLDAALPAVQRARDARQEKQARPNQDRAQKKQTPRSGSRSRTWMRER